MLGHVKLDTTTIYTISIRKLKEIHTATHPSAKLERKDEMPDGEQEDGQEEEAEVNQ